MEIIKPLRLGVLHRAYRQQQQPHLCVAVMALVALGGERPVLLPEQELWELVEDTLGDDGLIDLTMPKPSAEYLVSGIATTLHQAGKTCCAVEACVGDKQKRLTVFGDRYWLAGSTTTPQPFDVMPLDRNHAYGGAGHAENLAGIGHAPEWIDGQQVQRAPNIEHAHQLLTSPQQSLPPAGFGRVDISAPSHMALMGQYDERWLQEHAPGFPPSFDWHYFNLAPPDQQWRGQDSLPAGLSYRFVNMHPEFPVFAGQLPQAHARCFVTLRDDAPADGEDGALVFAELPLRLTTTWFVPHEECAILIYHGSMAIDDDDASKVAHLMPAFEALAAPRPLEHYEAVLAQRIDPDDGDLYVFDEAALISEALIGQSFDTEPLGTRPAGALEQRMDARLQREQHSRNEQMKAAGLPPSMPDVAQDMPRLQRLADLPQFDAALRQKETEISARMAVEQQMLHEELRQRASDPTAQVLLAQLENPGQAPAFEYASRAAQLTDMPPPAPFPAPTGFGAVLPPANDTARQLRQLYLHSVAFCAAAPALSPTASAQVREQVLQQYALNRDLSGLDLTGADLSGLDLTGARMVGALLESANLEGCKLDGADLSEAVLARARLSNSSLASARLVSANLSHVQVQQACFAGAMIATADWQEAEFNDCDFREVCIATLNLQQSEFKRCRFDDASMEDVDFQSCTLIDVQFEDAVLAGCNWLNCRLDKTGFDGAVLDGCSLAETDAIGISCVATILTDCYAALDCNLSDADFSAAELQACNWRDTLLERACLVGATLSDCDLSGALLHGANLQGVQAPGCLLIDASLIGARLAGANLMQAILRGADLRSADLTGAHLFEADLALVQLDASTVLDRVGAERANLYPRASVEGA
ncbi:Uncharacterized protein YjbI, contains pentapeptide repeats [Andreprevotia lacus DSM 23236]|jgi:uncharacterized protein YjbI with pentapeptide repeats|uniref:Uncharacterized protein YjbI, contains pentapeptide repeats n=1 Tax=Andreprevotia lacus DSM 23236 TaxID=1121001 RepID=A0A1W1XIT2_9NEIS|nr:DUF2169 domain-containing protein [Andreprevotia lacus]SMC23890.1 Uncharacterized protein YjbI, contains pentapeptide repeats [Andreprevotia lacus DSM 23236]